MRCPVPRNSPSSLRRHALIALLFGVFAASGASALVVGNYNTQPKTWRVHGKAVVTGATMTLSTSDDRYNHNSTGKPLTSNFAKINAGVIPKDASVKAAMVFWSGSYHRQSATASDPTVSFTLADNTTHTLSGNCKERRIGTIQAGSRHFSCGADITALLAQHGGGDTWNGTYTLSGLDSRVAIVHKNQTGVPGKQCPNLPGTQPGQTNPDPLCCGRIGSDGSTEFDPQDTYCQGYHASWSMVVIYDTQNSEPLLRDVYLYDEFVLIDEQLGTTGQIEFSLSGFNVGDPVQAQLTYYAVEGDKHLGMPAQSPQNPSPYSYACNFCYDFVQITGSKNSPAKLVDSGLNGQADNIFNSSYGAGIDLDTFVISDYLKTGDTSLSVLISSGDGKTSNNSNVSSPCPVDGSTDCIASGFGELVGYGWTMLEITRKAPKFRNLTTTYLVENKLEHTANPGDELGYELILLNDGPADANNVIVSLDKFLPPGLTYVKGSTVKDGLPIGDVAGTSPLAAGYNVGTMKAYGGTKVTISLRVKVDDPTTVTQIPSTAKTSFTYGDNNTEKGDWESKPTTITIEPATLDTPTLHITTGANKLKPGEAAIYAFTLKNLSGKPVSISALEIAIPAEVTLKLPIAGGVGTGTDKSTATGGLYGSGNVFVSDITIAANATYTFKFEVTVKTKAELVKILAGKPLNGHVVGTFGKVAYGGKSIRTDDPVKPGALDDTEFTINSPTDLTGSDKEGLPESNPLNPGNTIKFNIVINNNDAADVTVDVADLLASQLDYVSGDADLSFDAQTRQVTAKGVVAKKGQTRLTFIAKVKATATGGTFSNSATLSPQDGSPPMIVQTGTFTIVVGANFATSDMQVENLSQTGAFEPGDKLRYTITLRNTGKETSGNVLVATQALDTNLINIVPGNSGVLAGGKITWNNLSNIAPGNDVTLTFEATIKTGIATGTDIKTAALIQSNTGTVNISRDIKVQATPILSTFTNTVTSSGGALFEPGDTITYTITFANTGKGSIANAEMTATYDPLLTLTGVTGGGAISGQTISWKFGTFVPGTKTITVTATLPAAVEQGKSVSSQVTLRGDGLSGDQLSDDPAKPGASDPTVFAITSAAKVAITKTYTDLNGGVVQGGDEVQFTLTARNSGNAPALGFSLSDTLHAALTGITAAGGTGGAGSVNGQVVTFSRASLLPADGDVTFLIKATVAKTTASGTKVTNVATAGFNTSQTATSNTVNFDVVNLPDFGLSTKAVSAALIDAGQDVNYSLTIRNSGNLAGKLIQVTDKLPPQLENIQPGVGGTYDANTGTLRYTIDSLASGAAITLNYQARVSQPQVDGTTVCNQAAIISQENTTPSNTSPPGVPVKQGGEPTCFKVRSAPKVTVQKRALDAATGAVVSAASVKPKQLLRYELTVRNDGNMLASNVDLIDLVPTDLQDVQVPAPGAFASGTITWPRIPSLAIGAANARSFSFVARVKDGLDNGTKISNQAELKHTDGAVKSDDPALAGDADATVVTVISNVDFSKSTKTVVDLNGGEIRPGDQLEYTISVQNTGDATGKQTVVTDALDTRLTAPVALDGGVVNGGTITWGLGSMAPGDKASVRFRATIAKPIAEGSVISNQGQIAAQGFANPMLTDADLSTPIAEPTQVKVVANADLTTSQWLLLDHNGGSVEPGDKLTLTLTLKNTGDALATNTAIRALFDANQLVGIAAFDGGVATANAVDWSVPLISLSPTGDVSLRFSTTVATGVPSGTKVTVQAQIPGVSPAPKLTFEVKAQANLSTSTLIVDDETGWLAKIGQTGPGHTLRFEIVVRNNGKAATQSLTATLPLPTPFFSKLVALAGTVASGQLQFKLSQPLAPGGTVTFIGRATVNADVKDGTTFVPTAAVDADDPLASTVIKAAAITFIKRPILQLQKSLIDATSGVLHPGDEVQFAMTLVNVGNDVAKGVQVQDNLAGTGIVDAQVQAGGNLQGQTARWLVGDLAAGELKKVQLVGKVDGNLKNGDVITNQASVQATGLQDVPSNKVSAVLDYPELTVGVSLNPEPPAKDPAEPGDTVQLVVRVAATTALDGTNVRVVAPVDGTLFDVVNAGNGTHDAAKGTLTWTDVGVPALTAVKKGSVIALVARLRVKNTAPDASVAKVVAIATEGQTKLDWSSLPATLEISAKPVLLVQKTITDLNGDKLRPLDKVRYTLTVRVGGKAAAQHVELRDVIGEGLEVLAVQDGGTLANGTGTGAVVRWDEKTTPKLALIGPADTVQVTFDARITATVGDGSTVSNQATAKATGLTTDVLSDDPSTPEPNDPTARTVNVSSALAASSKIAIDENGPPLLQGDIVRWQLRVLATSTAPLTGVKLVDAVPAGTDYVVGSTTLNGQPVADLAGQPPLVQGLEVSSPNQGAGILQPGQAGAALVEFRSIVQQGTVAGTVIRNIATATANGVAPASVGPAEIAVGAGPSLHRTLKSVEVVDVNGNQAADPGEELVYTIAIHNDGGSAARQVVLTDALPAFTAYVGGSLRLDGKPLSDAKDADSGHFGADAAAGKPGVEVRIAALQVGAKAEVSFRVRVLDGAAVISNQAVVKAAGLAPEPSDADGDDGNGDQPTIITIAGKPPVLQVGKTVQDENAGSVQAGDRLRYVITIHNAGAADAKGVRLVDELPAGLVGEPQDVLLPPGAQSSFVAGPAASSKEPAKPGVWTVAGLDIGAGDTVTIAMRIGVGTDVGAGTAICNVAKAQAAAAVADGSQVIGGESEKACVTVGASAGSGTIQGFAFEDVGPQNGTYDEGIDHLFAGWSVIVQSVDDGGDGGTRVSSKTDENGRFVVDQVLAGAHTIKVLSPGGAVFASQTFEQPTGGATDLDIAIKPTGRVYDARTATLAAGVQVFIYHDGTDPVAPNALVAERDLGEGQQGQRTDATGAYVFTTKTGRSYRIDAAPGASGFAFPAAAHRPISGVAELDKDGFVVADSVPRLAPERPRYFARFSRLGKDASGTAPASPRHNHLPVDALTDAIKLTVQFSKKEATIGEVVHVMVRAENHSELGLIADRLNATGGVVLRNVLPRGFAYVDGTARAWLQKKGSSVEAPVTLANVQGPLMQVRQHRAVSDQDLNLDLPAGGALTIRFAAVITPAAELFHHIEDTAQLFGDGGVPVSEQAKARLLVAGDPIFDRGTVLGKVFCDTNGDGEQDGDEPGLPGARVYADNGHFADADRHGRLHLMDIAPGNHLFKLDKDTLPPGSSLTTDEKRVLYVTRGVGLSLRFGVKCVQDSVGPDAIERAPAPPADQAKPAEDGSGVVTVTGNADERSLHVDGRKLPARRVAAQIAHGLRPKELVASDQPVVVAAGAPLGLWIQAVGSFDGYRVQVRAVGKDGRSRGQVAVRLFRGKPPATVAVRFAAGALVPGGRYVAMVRGTTRFGAAAWSAPMPFEIALPAPPIPASPATAKAAKRPADWRFSPADSRAHLNGNEVPIAVDGRFIARFQRPADGRILIGMRGADGGGRDEYLSLPTKLDKTRVRPPSDDDIIYGVKSVGSKPVDEPEPEPELKLPPLPAAEPEPEPAPIAPKPAPIAPKPAPIAPKPAPIVPQPAPIVPPSPKPTPAIVAPKPAPIIAKPAVAKPAVVAPKPAPVAAIVPPRPIAPKPAPPADAWRDVPVSFAPAEGLSIAGRKLTPVMRNTALRSPDAPMPFVGGRILGRAVLSVGDVPADAVAASIVLLDRSGRTVARSQLSVPVPETFLWNPNDAKQYAPLQQGTYGMAIEVFVPAASEQGGPAALVGWRSQPSKLTLSATDPALIPAGTPDLTVTAGLFGDDGAPTESLSGWLEKKAAVLRKQRQRIAVVSVHSNAKYAQKRTERAAGKVRTALIDAGVRPDQLLVIPVGTAVKWSDPSDAAMGDDRLEIRYRPQNLSTSGKPAPFKMTTSLWIGGKPIIGNGSGTAPQTVRVRVGKPTLVELVQDDGKAVLWKRTFADSPGAPSAPTAPRPKASNVAGFGGEVLDGLNAELDGKKPGTTPTNAVTTNAAQDTGPIAAADLQVVLPKSGAELGGTRLAVHGKTAPTNKLTINGRAVTPDPDGRFFATVELPVGESKLEVKTVDVAGNKASVTRKLKVKENAVFLLAIADTAVAQVGSNLSEMTEKTTYQAGNYLLHGRGAVYLKGRVKGSALGFKSLKFTAHLDTSKNAYAEDFATNLFDPDRYYPVYGDDSEDVQDVKARGPLYVMVQADRSKLRIGNLRTAIEGQELLRYDRAMYGAMLDYQKVFAKDFDTRVKVFAAPEDGAMSRRTDLLRGTGGSLYYLSGRDVLQGSEKIWIVVRDRDSGVELGRVPQTRNNDYTIDYREGRLLFKAPVSSAVDAFFSAGGLQPGQHLTWNGHPAFVQATYEARSQTASGGTNAGIQVGEKMFGGKLEIGGAYAQESRDGGATATYRVTGVHAKFKLGKASGLRAEYAYTESRDSLVAVSEDGGLTFGMRDEPSPLQSAVSGQALGLHLDADLGDIGEAFGWKAADTGLAHTASRFGHLKAHYQRVGGGFHTTGVLTEQGTQKFGLDTRLSLAKTNTLALRYDGILSDGQAAYQGVGLGSTWGVGGVGGVGGGAGVVNNGSFSPYARQMVTLQDSHRIGKLTVLGALSWNRSEDAQGGAQSAQTLSGGASYKVSDKLSLRGAQLYTVGGFAPNLQNGALDRLITEVGVDYKMLDNLAITVRERLGWGGQNATMAGIRTQLSEDSSLYLQQRLEDSYDTGRPVSNTVVGAESRYGKDKSSRAYGEYQVAGMGSGAGNRAIMGVGKRFQVAQGLHLDATYERSQTFSGPTGQTSRDAMSLGGEWLRGRMWKLTSRQEARLDEADAALGGMRKLQVLSLNAISARVTDAVTFFGRANYMRTENQTLERLEAETLQATTGLAFRPLRSDRLNIISKYTQLREQRPSNLNTGITEHSIKDIISIEPILELPFGFSWSNKLAFRRAHESLGLSDMPDITSDLWLFISRLGYHLAARVDINGEYRYLSTPLVGDNQHGALFEASYIIAKTLRIGAGYNFSRFIETSAGDITRSEGGFFIRVVGMY